MKTTEVYTNHLANETSPYLKQHVHNPVDWYPWSDDAWAKAKKENKLVLVSIGYSSCHWCHVMEHESFEKDSTAHIMNEHFVCIKVDREERPDIDQVYMTAVQLMTGSGGWPLNCFTLPDGRPVYGGTYFPNASWNDLLIKLDSFYRANPEQMKQYAEELTQGLNKLEIFKPNTAEKKFTTDSLTAMIENWRLLFDTVEGGPNRSPKFPMPNNYEFLLQYAVAFDDQSLLNYVKLTLDKMAYGGIYDQLGGGFARYSTDSHWKVPHFEKMLYDNAQLITLYSKAYQKFGDEQYKKTVFESMEWIRREMTSENGGFYSAQDADSEGKEGKYYIWKKDELESLIGSLSLNIPTEKAWQIFSAYFNVNKTGLWEENEYILLRKKTDQEIAKEFSISTGELSSLIELIKQKLLEERNKRIRPGLDDKLLVSWNGLMIRACCDAYAAFGEKKFLDEAVRAANLLLQKSRLPDGSLTHLIAQNASGKNIPGFLEDIAFTAEAFIALYQVTFDEKWLNESKALVDYAMQHFYDKESGLFWFTSDTGNTLITRKKEITDNVTPSSNSSLAKSLFYLGKYFDDRNYEAVSLNMLHAIINDMPQYGSGYSNWAMLLLYEVKPFYEIVITGPGSESLRMEMSKNYLPCAVIAGSQTGDSHLPLLQDRFSNKHSYIYVCENQTCKLPVNSVKEALAQINY